MMMVGFNRSGFTTHAAGDAYDGRSAQTDHDGHNSGSNHQRVFLGSIAH